MTIIQKKSLAQEVFEVLKQKIEKGAYAIDEKLPTEPELMEQFGVGRSTIREAVKLLSQSGFIRVQQGLGTFVSSTKGHQSVETSIKKADFEEIVEVRSMLELKIIESAVANRKKKHIETMRHYLILRNKFANKGDISACIEADINFHMSIAESTGNKLLYELYKTLSQHVSTFFIKIYLGTDPFVQSQQQHEELVDHIEKRDIKQALKTGKKIVSCI